jgi:hypothetical protein
MRDSLDSDDEDGSGDHWCLVGSSPYYLASFMIAAAALIAAATLVERAEFRASQILALVLGAVGPRSPFASLALSAISSTGMAS